VLAADPGIVPNAKRIEEVTYTELRELAYTGARVLHEEAVFPVRRRGIPIHILNTFAPEAPGTIIRAERDVGEQVVVGIAGLKGFTVFHIEKVLMNAELGFGRRVLDVFERLQISYEHMPSGIDTMSVVVSDKQLKSLADQVVEDLHGAVRPDRVRVYPGMALIATVGRGMSRRIGVASRLFNALARAAVNVRMIDQGSSEQNIIVGVEAVDFERAVVAIYDEFIER
jgi:aspartate kinase